MMSGDSRNNLFEGKDASYRVGDEILRCRIPFAYVVNQKLAETTCDECLKRTSGSYSNSSSSNKLLRCSGVYQFSDITLGREQIFLTSSSIDKGINFYNYLYRLQICSLL